MTESLTAFRATLASHRRGRVGKERRIVQVVTLLDRMEEILTYCDNCDRYGGMPSTVTLRRIVEGETTA